MLYSWWGRRGNLKLISLGSERLIHRCVVQVLVRSWVEGRCSSSLIKRRNDDREPDCTSPFLFSSTVIERLERARGTAARRMERKDEKIHIFSLPSSPFSTRRSALLTRSRASRSLQRKERDCMQSNREPEIQTSLARWVNLSDLGGAPWCEGLDGEQRFVERNRSVCRQVPKNQSEKIYVPSIGSVFYVPHRIQ